MENNDNYFKGFSLDFESGIYVAKFPIPPDKFSESGKFSGVELISTGKSSVPPENIFLMVDTHLKKAT